MLFQYSRGLDLHCAVFQDTSLKGLTAVFFAPLASCMLLQHWHLFSSQVLRIRGHRHVWNAAPNHVRASTVPYFIDSNTHCGITLLSSSMSSEDDLNQKLHHSIRPVAIGVQFSSCSEVSGLRCFTFLLLKDMIFLHLWSFFFFFKAHTVHHA